MDLVSYQDFLFFIRDKADEALQIVLILVGSGLLIRAVRILADRLVKFVQDDDPLTTNQREQRAVTLAGIFKGVFKIVIVLVAGLTILGILGINTAPLIAGAGVAGLAISFGAQNLIRDFISGFFILLENQYKVGDVIRAAGVSGQVEDMNLRITCCATWKEWLISFRTVKSRWSATWPRNGPAPSSMWVLLTRKTSIGLFRS